MQRTFSSTLRDGLKFTHEQIVQRARHTNAPSQHRSVRRLATIFTPLIVLLIWYGVTLLGWIEPFLIPPPEAVALRFAAVLGDGSLLHHTQITLQAVGGGLVVGLGVGVSLGYVIARSPLLGEVFAPVIIALQSTPVVAYAPLLVIWFGTGIESKIVTCALIVFFPMLMNTVVGIRNVPHDLRELMRVSRATAWQTFTKLELPAAMPILLTGLKTSATLAVIGAVVGEFVYANAGLGFLVIRARNQFDTPLVFVGVLSLTAMASTLYILVSVLERILLAWQHRTR